MTRQVRIGSRVVGDASVAVLAGPAAAADIAWASLRRHHGEVDAAAELARLRTAAGRPLVVEPFSTDDLPAIRAHADGVLVGAAWMQDFQLIRAVAKVGLPVVIQRGHAATLEEWLAAAEYCAAEGNRDVVLCETGSRTHLAERSPDLLLHRAAQLRSGLPVIVETGGSPEIAAAVVAAGADGLLLAEDATPEESAGIRELGRLLGPVLRAEDPADLPSARAAIDRVDTLLATLLERRARLAGRVQRLKPVGGFAGRDPERERQVVAAMAERAPRLGADRMGRIMAAVIETGLEVAEEDRRDSPEPVCG